MSEQLTPEEKTFLRELRSNPLWQSILEKFRAPIHPVPRYKPNQGDAREQELDWIFYSGVDRAHENLIKRLTNG